MQKVIQYLIIFLIVFIFSCERKSEKELYEQAMNIEKPQERITALENFLINYPECIDKERVTFRLFRDYVTLKNEQKAIYYADRYFKIIPDNNKMSRYNSISWTLAENNLALDSAKIYANRAVELAKGTDERNLNMIRDTQAFAYYQAGDIKNALEIQLKAMTGNENDYDFLSRLGLYQHDAGETEKGFHTMARSVLLGGGLESGKYLQKWMTVDFKNEDQRLKFAKKLANETVKEFGKEGMTDDKKSQSALLFSILNVDLPKAEKWAIEAVKNLGDDAEFSQRLNFNINLASVYQSSGKQKLVLQTLKETQEYASIYDVEYWFSLANAYIDNDQRKEAIDAFLTGMLWETQPKFVDVLKEQGLTETEIENLINNKKTELINFHPGEYIKDNNYAGRVVLTELFTGAECSPCLGADLAMDLIAEYYPRDIVTILEYHLHIPGPDPLTNPDTEARYKYYGNNFGTPTVFFNGHGKLVGGGSELVKKDLFQKYVKSIDKYKTLKPIAEINLNASQENGILKVNSEIVFSAPINSDHLFNIAVVERTVDYAGSNGITKHAFVVRYLLTGAEGEKIQLTGTTFNFSNEINLDAIDERQAKYLQDFKDNPPKRFRTFIDWKDKKENVIPEQLALVSWIQNNETKEIIQSQYLKF